MAVLPIRKFPDPVLKEKAKPVEKIDKDIQTLIKNMADTMYEAPGVGLAANQVGVLKQVLVIDVDDHLMVFINPEITECSDETEEVEEGCLSVGAEVVTMVVTRPVKIKVKAQNEKGETIEVEADELLARALQHEIDHLNGILILDRTTPEQKRRVLKEITRQTPLV